MSAFTFKVVVYYLRNRTYHFIVNYIKTYRIYASYEYNIFGISIDTELYAGASSRFGCAVCVWLCTCVQDCMVGCEMQKKVIFVMLCF